MCEKCQEKQLEIERLTAELGELRPAVHANKVQAEEINRLTAELAGTRDELYSVDKAAKELGAERDQLRAALEQILKESFAHIMLSIARQALAGDRPKDRPQPGPSFETIRVQCPHMVDPGPGRCLLDEGHAGPHEYQ